MEVTPAAIDAILVPFAVIMLLGYHAFLFFKVKHSPYQTAMGVNHRARRLWVKEMLHDNHKKNVLAVQTIRNSIMESSLMATTCVLLTAGLATYFTMANNTLKQPPLAGGGGGHQGVLGSVKSLSILTCFMVAFLCHTQSIRFLNHVNYMVNIQVDTHLDDTHVITENYLANLLERGTILYSFGSRIFYLAIPLLLWLFGSIAMFLCSVILLHCFYHVDFVQVTDVGGGDHINVRKKISDQKEPPIDCPSNYMNHNGPHSV